MENLGTDENAQDFSLARDRSRRSISNKKNDRFSALEKLKQAKATGDKYRAEIFEEKNVYEEVDENEYSKIVKRRQDDDWIVDDGTGQYVEDGREIFEDDEKSDMPKSKKSRQSETKAVKNVNIRAPDSKPANIKSMFAAASAKPKKIEKENNIDEDALLGNIMQELKQGKASQSFLPTPVRLKKKTYSSPFTTPEPTSFNPRCSSDSNSVRSKLATEMSRTKISIDEGRNNKRSDNPTNGYQLHNGDSDSADTNATIHEMGITSNSDRHDSINYNDDKISEFAAEEISLTSDLALKSKSVQPKKFSCLKKGNIVVGTSVANNGQHRDEHNKAVSFGDEDFEELGDAEWIRQLDDNEKTDKKISSPSKEVTITNEWLKSTVEDPIKAAPSSQDSILPTNPLNCSNLDCTQVKMALDADGVFKMYWLDAFEDYFKHPGVVYLFGKTWMESMKTYTSVCVVCKNIERRLFVLPRQTKFDMKLNLATDEPVSILDVYNEFDKTVAEPRNILMFKSRKVTKSYVFGLENVPTESEYLEIRYAADLPIIPIETKGKTFSHIFGTNTSALETFLLDRKLKGPCWIDIKSPKIITPTSSWCKVEMILDHMEDIKISTNQSNPPPLVVMSMGFKTHMAKGNSGEILGISCMVNTNYCLDKMAKNKSDILQEFTIFSKPKECLFPFDFKIKLKSKYGDRKMELVSSERELLALLVAKFATLDPDVIVCHDLAGLGLDLALNKLMLHKIGNWSRIGRLKRSVFPKGALRCSIAFCGRLLSDVMISAKELIRCRSYDLSELVSQILLVNRNANQIENIIDSYSLSSNLLEMIEEMKMDSTYIMRILNELNVLPLALQLTNICGNTLAKTLLGGRSERNEFLLLHAFNANSFIVPDKIYNKKINQQIVEENETQNVSRKSGKKKAAYLGGLVLEPKRGFYDHYILVLDFNSLYPSIIQEYNICFTTFSVLENIQDDVDEIESLCLNKKEVGILPTEIRKLVESRKQVRGLMKVSDVSQDQMMQYDIRQKALKLTANSMYGCLGFANSRFYAKNLASIVTAKGREILLKTKDLVQSMNLEVIYGDTDSIMVNTGLDDYNEVYKMGNKIKTEVNKLYRLLEIDIDGVFKSMLLLKKKKYAALTVHKNKNGDLIEAQELKGLDIVRRDWCELAKDAGQFVVSEILSGKLRDQIIESIHSKLIQVGQQVKDGTLSQELFYITKQLTKNPEDYPDKNSQPHVLVALRLNAGGGHKLKAGDTVYYVICQDETNLPAMQRAYHPEELIKNKNLSIDIKYYLTQQIHPVISRLCDPIDGTDAAMIAECLGLDPASYKQSIKSREAIEENETVCCLVSDEEKYKNCDDFVFECKQCGVINKVDSFFRNSESGTSNIWLLRCSNKDCEVAPVSNIHRIRNKLVSEIRTHIRKYYEGWLVCEDVACHHRSRLIPLAMQGSSPLCPVCSRSTLNQEYNEKMLYTQLCFYESLFDVEKVLNKMEDSSAKDQLMKLLDEEMLNCQNLKNLARSYIQKSAFNEINLSKLFCPPK